MMYGTADPTGSADIWRRVTAPCRMASWRCMDGAGHTRGSKPVPLSA